MIVELQLRKFPKHWSSSFVHDFILQMEHQALLVVSAKLYLLQFVLIL